jgi:hypothetical protein
MMRTIHATVLRIAAIGASLAGNLAKFAMPFERRAFQQFARQFLGHANRYFDATHHLIDVHDTLLRFPGVRLVISERRLRDPRAFYAAPFQVQRHGERCWWPARWQLIGGNHR